MTQDPNVERLIIKSIEPLNKQISMLQIELNDLKQQLALLRVSNSNGVKGLKYPLEIQKVEDNKYDLYDAKGIVFKGISQDMLNYIMNFI